jgi:hypothetical protein
MSPARYKVPSVESQQRIWHDLTCPARDVAHRRIKGVCTCPPERWLDPAAVPVQGAGSEEEEVTRDWPAG